MQGLDALRGLAAITVVVMHSNYTPTPITHGYLAVDFFFMLSGFVIASAYEAKLGSDLSALSFMRARLARLYPILFIGAVLAAFAFPFLAAGGWLPEYSSHHCAVLAQFLLLPFVCSSEAFVLNGPYWSICDELLANLMHSLILPWLTLGRLALLVALSGVLLAVTTTPSDGVNLGWERSGIVGGLLRVCFDYFAGVLLFRTSPWWAQSVQRIPLSCVAIALAVILLTPEFPLPHFHTRGRDLISIVVLLPLIIMCASQWGKDSRLARWLGILSYPLYATHVPLLAFGDAIVGQHRGVVGAFANSITLFGVVLAGLLLGLFLDRPLHQRRWVKQRGLP